MKNQGTLLNLLKFKISPIFFVLLKDSILKDYIISSTI